MTNLVIFLLFCQTLGACIGVFTSVWSEFAYIHAMRNGRIDSAERTHLNIIAKGLRFGMTILLIASFALVIIAYSLHGALQPALTASYWTFISLSLLIIGVSWALSRQHVSFALGSAAIITAWWLLAYLTLGQLPIFFFGSAIALYVVLTAIVYVVLRYIRILALHKK